jgi:hypothetical protein
MMSIKDTSDQKFINRYNWKEIQDRHDKGESLPALIAEMRLGTTRYKRALDLGILVKKHVVKRSVTEETKKRISEGRKMWLKENPDKHPWKNSNKFKSLPCENFKKYLIELNIPHISEFSPELEDRHFSIDIALPEKMIAIEINGNQHYDSSGKLKPYYQERNDMLEKHGWTVYQIHYSACYNFKKIQEFTENISNSEFKVDFDYFKYNLDLQTSHVIACKTCGEKASTKDRNCNKCANFLKRKIERPSSDELYKMLWEIPKTQIAKAFGVSDNAIKKWAKDYNLIGPTKGYWRKKECGKL